MLIGAFPFTVGLNSELQEHSGAVLSELVFYGDRSPPDKHKSTVSPRFTLKLYLPYRHIHETLCLKNRDWNAMSFEW